MKIWREESLRNFEFWSGAVCRAEQLTDEQFDQIENILDELYPDGVDETFINDLFWHDFETIADWLGLALNDSGDLYDPSEEVDDDDEEEEEDSDEE